MTHDSHYSPFVNYLISVSKKDKIKQNWRIWLGMATGRGGDGFRYPTPIPVKKIHPHPHTQTQRLSNFYSILIPTG